MIVSQTVHSAAKRAGAAVLLAALCAAPALRAQVNPSSDSNYSSSANAFYGSVTVQPVTDEELKLSLDDAVRRGLENNLGLKQAEYSEKNLRGQYNQAVQQFLPTISLVGDAGYHMYNLAALGFGPGLVQEILPILPPGTDVSGLSFITRAQVTEGQRLNTSRHCSPVPSLPAIKPRARECAPLISPKCLPVEKSVQQVASAYLHAIAAASAVENARALEEADRVAYNNAHEAHLAGTAANLDELRARVQYQTEQQARIQDENIFQKDLILLKREIGLDPGQKIVLTDRAPYSELAVQTPEELRAIAYKNRQDYQNLQNQVQELKSVHQAYRAQRLPTLSFNGYYGVTEVTSIGAHGNFAATGTLKIPIFREAELRGGIDASKAQWDSAEAQLDDLRVKIDQQVRTALLDVAANKKLVDVAQSNVELATRALSDETDRVNAGVDDTLPLVDAQASLSTAQNNFVASLYQYNTSKLQLARAAGILEQQYRDYLGK